MADFILAGDFRKGVTFEMDGKVVTIVDFLHVKPGKGAAFVRTKLRDVINGGTVEMTFNPTAKFQTAHIEHKNMVYSTEICIILWIRYPTICCPSTAKA